MKSTTTTEASNMLDVTITIGRLAGSDDTIITVTHDDGNYIAFKRDNRSNYLHTWDVTGTYADHGHDADDDRALAAKV